MNLPIAQERIDNLIHTFLETNAHINLSALRTYDSCLHGNVLDSVAAYETIQNLTTANSKILDIGTGGGFPLLPLAMTLPDRHFVGNDAIAKKIHAIEHIAKTCAIHNVSFVINRCEELGKNAAHREMYDICTSRAVAPLNVLLEYMTPLVKPNGYILCFKSTHIETELHESLHARSVLDCHLIKTIPYTLAQDWGTRQLLLFQKMAPTNSLYPRGVGIAKKYPLL